MQQNDFITTMKQSGLLFKDKWHNVFGASAVVLATIFGVSLFPLLGFFLAVLTYSFLNLGLKRHTVLVCSDQPSNIENIFVFKKMIPAFCLFVTRTMFSLLWGMLLIVPGIIAWLNYSFAPYLLTESDCNDCLTALDKSKSLTLGYRWKILLLYLLHFLCLLIICCLCFALAILINVFTPLSIGAKFGIAIPLGLIIYTIFIMPFMEIAMANVYIDAKSKQKIDKRVKSTSKKTK